MFNSGFLLLALSDVGKAGYMIFGIALGIPHQADGEPDRIGFTTLAFITGFSLPRSLLLQYGVQVAIEADVLLAVGAQYGRFVTKHISGQKAGYLFKAVIDGDDAIFPVGNQDRLVTGFKHFGRETELIFHLLAQSDIAHYQQDFLFSSGQ